MSVVRMHAVASGHVQGVGFRWSARAEAHRLGVTGWVRNLPDSTVETEIEGDESAVQRMLDWLRHGPAGARVDGVSVTELDAIGGEGFEIQ